LTDHYFSPRPQTPHRPGLVRVVLPDVYLELATDAGVFSPGRLDPGTRLLLDSSPAPPSSGDLLDLGCGYGPIACVLAKRSPGATVWAVDVNERALELCARNAAAAGLSNVRCVLAGDPSVPARLAGDPSVPPRLAGIWSNPPVRIGKAALHDLLSGWLGRLAPGGQAYLVAGRNLGADSLHRWLAEQGWTVTRRAARSGYRLLQVEYSSERAVVTPP
jgi:16S rRNA (guanine1207-N2)-methyltransferase